MSILSGVELTVSKVQLVYYEEVPFAHQNENMDIMKVIVRADDFFIKNAVSREFVSPSVLKKVVHLSNMSIAFEFLNQDESTSAPAAQTSEGQPQEKNEFQVMTEFYCDMDFEANLADQIDIKANIKIDEIFLKLSQRQIMYLLLHHNSRTSVTHEHIKKFRMKSPLQRFQYLGRPRLTSEESAEAIQLQDKSHREDAQDFPQVQVGNIRQPVLPQAAEGEPEQARDRHAREDRRVEFSGRNHVPAEPRDGAADQLEPLPRPQGRPVRQA